MAASAHGFFFYNFYLFIYFVDYGWMSKEAEDEKIAVSE